MQLRKRTLSSTSTSTSNVVNDNNNKRQRHEEPVPAVPTPSYNAELLKRFQPEDFNETIKRVIFDTQTEDLRASIHTYFQKFILTKEPTTNFTRTNITKDILCGNYRIVEKTGEFSTNIRVYLVIFAIEQSILYVQEKFQEPVQNVGFLHPTYKPLVLQIIAKIKDIFNELETNTDLNDVWQIYAFTWLKDIHDKINKHNWAKWAAENRFHTLSHII